MNETLSVIERRRSTRVYANQPLTQDDKDAILRAAMRSPTAGNQMLYSILEIEDQALKDTLAETCDHQPFIAKAPWVLVFLADYQRWVDYFVLCGCEERARVLGREARLPQAGDLMLAACDAVIAAQTAVIAAESLGIGSCYIGDVLENYETHQRLLRLPRYALPVAMLCFGRPVKEHRAEDQTSRFDPRFIVHRNAYQPASPDELRSMFQEREQRQSAAGPGAFVDGALNFGQHMYLRKFIADFSIEMSRSVQAMMKSWS